MAQKKGFQGIVKVCPDPGCEAVWHNIPKIHTRCNDCSGWLIQINEDTFWKKFSNNWFQYDFQTGEYFRPEKPIVQLSLDLE
tara:strand:+ start:16938 stop:17183 length:246 start_codon:yes stop_codon:yes gene_type:complete